MSPQANQRPRVIFASAGVGAGHNQAARALLAGLTRADATIEAEWVDILPMADSLFRLYYAGGYAAMVTYAPYLYGLGYRVTDHPRGRRRSLCERRRLISERWAARRFVHWLEERLPALVVSTHFLIPPLLGRMIARGRSDLRSMVVVTDHDLHRYWCAEEVERFFVATEGSRDRLANFGVDPARVELTGIPVHPKWHAPCDEAAARRAWSLPADKPVVALSGGVDFTLGKVERLAEDLCRRLPHARIVVLAGSNKHLLARLAAKEFAMGVDPQLRPISFTDRIDELIRLADVVVTKPGGMTTSECAAVGAAMVLLKPIPGQEASNARWLCENNAAVMGRSVEQAAAHVQRLLNNPAERHALAANARALSGPATDTIVQRIRETLDAMA